MSDRTDQDDRTAALAVYSMAANIVAARIAAGGIPEMENTHIIAALVREQARALTSGTLLGTLASYFDPENYTADTKPQSPSLVI